MAGAFTKRKSETLRNAQSHEFMGRAFLLFYSCPTTRTVLFNHPCLRFVCYVGALHSLRQLSIDMTPGRRPVASTEFLFFFFFLPPLFESPLPSSYSPLPCSGVPPIGLYIQREACLCKLGGERRQRRFPYIADELYNLPKLSFHLKQPARTQTEETLFFFFSSS